MITQSPPFGTVDNLHFQVPIRPFPGYEAEVNMERAVGVSQEMMGCMRFIAKRNPVEIMICTHESSLLKHGEGGCPPFDALAGSIEYGVTVEIPCDDGGPRAQ